MMNDKIENLILKDNMSNWLTLLSNMLEQRFLSGNMDKKPSQKQF